MENLEVLAASDFRADQEPSVSSDTGKNDEIHLTLPPMRAPNHREQNFAQRFLRVIEAGDELGLLSLLESPRKFSEDGVTLYPESYDFVFGRGSFEDRGYKTIWDIYSLGKLQFLVEELLDDTIIFYFIPEIYEDQTQTLDFFMFEWMTKYFACKLIDDEGQLLVEINLCFAETEGPMPDPNMYD